MGARGSERVTFSRLPGVPRVCAVCGRHLRVVDVGRVHSNITYVAGVGVASTSLFCREHRNDGYAS
jgi:hypothetical protein